MSGVPYTFGNATTTIALSNLDTNFATPVTIGNTTVGLGNTTTTVGNLTLTNTTITTGNVTTDLVVHGLTVGLGGGSVSTNTAVGTSALTSNTSGGNNTAVGYQAGYTNSTGAYNTFLGYQAGYTSNINGNAVNTCIGSQAGYSLTIGGTNTFIGPSSGYYVTTGSNNTILGGYNGNQGGLDIRTSSNYIVLSDGAGNPRGIFDSNGKLLVGQTSSGSGAIIQASSASGTEPVIQLNNTSTGNQGGFLSSFNTGAGSTSSFHFKGTSAGVGTWYLYGNGTTSFSSDLRLKKNVETTRDGYLEDLCKLRVVKYQWSANEDTSTKELGLIAQEVEQVFPSLIETTTDKIGEVENTKVLKASVLPFMLLKALQELKAEFDAYKATHP